MDLGQVERFVLKQVDCGSEGNKRVVGEPSCGSIQLINSLLLEVDVYLLHLKLGHRVDFLEVQVCRYCKSLFTIVILGFLCIKWTVHNLKIDLHTSRLFLEVR